MRLAWGAKVSPEFRGKVQRIAAELGCDPSWLMACMAFETGETFSPSVKNPNSSATGLIQFMAATAAALGTTPEALAAMSAEDQLDYVARYFAPYKGRIKSLSDCYMAILWPKAIGLSEDAVIFGPGSAAYLANKGLDINHDSAVSKREAAAFVAAKLVKGAQFASDEPDAVAPERKPTMPFLALLSAFGPVIAQLIPQVAKAVGGGERAQQNVAAAQAIFDTVVQASGQANIQSAVEAMQADPALVTKVTEAVVTDPVVMGLLEIGGGVKAARDADAVATQAEKPFWYSPAFWITVLVITPPVDYMVFTIVNRMSAPSEQLITQVVTGLLGILAVAGAFYYGTTYGSQKKDQLIAERK